MPFFHELIYQPLYNLLVFLYNFLPGSDFGIAIIVTTILLRFILVPVYRKQIESQQKIQELQPKIKELQQKYKDDKERQTKEMMALYKQHKTNPFSGCLPLIVQLVFLIAIYRILFSISSQGLIVSSEELYSFIPNPGNINQLFISIIDLTKPSIPIAALAALAQYFQTKMLMQKNQHQSKDKVKPSNSDEPDIAQMMSKQMLYLGPVLTLVIGIKFPAGLALYWLSSTLFMLVQQIILQKKKLKVSKA